MCYINPKFLCATKILNFYRAAPLNAQYLPYFTKILALYLPHIWGILDNWAPWEPYTQRL